MPAVATIAGIHRAGRPQWQCRRCRIRPGSSSRVTPRMSAGSRPTRHRPAPLPSQAPARTSHRRARLRTPVALAPRGVLCRKLYPLHSPPVVCGGEEQVRPWVGVTTTAASVVPGPRPMKAALAAARIHAPQLQQPMPADSRRHLFASAPGQPWPSVSTSAAARHPAALRFSELACRKPASPPPAQGRAGGGLFLRLHDRLAPPSSAASPVLPGPPSRRWQGSPEFPFRARDVCDPPPTPGSGGGGFPRCQVMSPARRPHPAPSQAAGNVCARRAAGGGQSLRMQAAAVKRRRAPAGRHRRPASHAGRPCGPRPRGNGRGIAETLCAGR